MYRFHAPRLTRGWQIAAALMLALAAACGDGPTGGSGPRPGPQKPVPQDTTPVVASVELDPGSLDLLVAGTRGMLAIVRSQRGDMITGRMLQWTSSDSSVARVDINGNVTALKLGTSVITATLDGRQGQATIRVVPPPPPAPVAHVTITGGGGPNLGPGETRELGVVLHAANGSQLMGRVVTWSSSDSSVARVSQNGLVAGLRGGTATISATSEGVTGTVTFIIPEWLVFDLDSVGPQPLPRVVAFTADTTSRTEHGMVVRERRVRMTFGRLWLSTIDWRYRQRYDLQTWQREITHAGGNTITGTETLVSTDVIRDEGLATEYDPWVGSPIYTSTTYEGHTFRMGLSRPGNLTIHQSIPGTTYGQFTLYFSR
ncbi:MAG TPA: Ig-like domain-containing protein [Longimicrobium sp.]|jgi:hypothetical protein|uniref:Ig-like domain-containing protein n=1 Tax=Longimicrobium sp. TaxID=2029185 RepID=UPI002ED99136